MTASLMDVYERLLAAYGPQGWWPGETPLEVMVGAVLTQNTSWTNVARAIEQLRQADALSLSVLAAMHHEELAELIRPAGYYRLKARRLLNLIGYVQREYDGSLEAMFASGLPTLREELLTVNGIGPETADSILLYAGGLSTFVVDTYTARVLKRHGWIEPEADYHAIKDYMEGGLPCDERLFNEYHALLVRVGKQHCGTSPKCDGCPLEPLLPAGGACDLSSG